MENKSHVACQFDLSYAVCTQSNLIVSKRPPKVSDKVLIGSFVRNVGTNVLARSYLRQSYSIAINGTGCWSLTCSLKADLSFDANKF